MRITLFGALVASVVLTGCAKTDAAAAGNALAAPVSGAPDAKNTPVATLGRAEAPPAPEPSSVEASSREMTIPAGTWLSVTLDTAVGSDISRVEEAVTAHLTRPIRVHGQTVLEEGSRLGGVVTDATRSAKVKGRAHVAVRFETVTPRGGDQRYAMRTASVGRTAAATKQKDALEIGAPAAGGAIIGALVGGKKGALVGGAVGGGAGTAVVLSTRGKEVHLAKGTAVSVKLTSPLTVRVRG
jgi:hypothetical protein